jgi:hypothetical protein
MTVVPRAANRLVIGGVAATAARFSIATDFVANGPSACRIPNRLRNVTTDSLAVGAYSTAE